MYWFGYDNEAIFDMIFIFKQTIEKCILVVPSIDTLSFQVKFTLEKRFTQTGILHFTKVGNIGFWYR